MLFSPAHSSFLFLQKAQNTHRHDQERFDDHKHPLGDEKGKNDPEAEGQNGDADDLKQVSMAHTRSPKAFLIQYMCRPAEKELLLEIDQEYADIGGIDAADARGLPNADGAHGRKLLRRLDPQAADRHIVKIRGQR